MKKVILSVLVLTLMVSCGDKSKNDSPDNTAEKKEVKEDVAELDPMKDKGIGPIKNITLAAEIDQKLVTTGTEIFKSKCSACHKMGKRFVGPDLVGVTKKQSPEWIMNMILNPEEMVQKNPTAKALLAEYLSPMANQNLSEDEARAVLEYFRTLK